MYHISSELMTLLLAGDEEAFGVWYERTVDDFSRFVVMRYSLDPEVMMDLISNFYIKVWNILPTLDDEMNENRLYGLCWTMLNNLIKDYFKKKKEKTFADLLEADRSEDDFVPVSSDDVAKLFEVERDVDRIMAALQALDNASYDIFALKYLQ
jgi:DNA-directed RNA polymerase specialized sigma24 family protein